MHPAFRLLLLPFALAAVWMIGVLLSTGGAILFELFGGGPRGPKSTDEISIMPLIVMGLTGYALVTVTERMSPNRCQRILPMALGVIVALLYAWSTYVGLYNGQGVIRILDDIAVVVGAGVGVLHAYRGGCHWD